MAYQVGIEIAVVIADFSSVQSGWSLEASSTAATSTPGSRPGIHRHPLRVVDAAVFFDQRLPAQA
jgi:hypothetical protein